ncbi:hypothetical protein BN990_01111 [Virgibacillus salexigens]|uniref:Uncharacterized protein n=1 Tax=Virgibacillus massiliensis TaxID=1462526 RepID=A0A024QA64_9BACI|nr:hypothetical protein BN990_01111 [Virgibacillus massiliensis]
MLLGLPTIALAHTETTEDDSNKSHNWQEYSRDTNIIDTGTHEFTYWKNFMKHKRTCQISQKVETIVYYCDVHDHTKSETKYLETIHSHKHS